ncbi:hypothetical protein MUK42_06085 [Musa troglodytarum]|uniref:Uncharacterized protein n=1 Tax=Musa troglodytarum TaxID=320322 RepID=A0A9E7K7Z5_9LILI|nr:hypothetical protein MUK42_06085 [Musa troglodytarum]
MASPRSRRSMEGRRRRRRRHEASSFGRKRRDGESGSRTACSASIYRCSGRKRRACSAGYLVFVFYGESVFFSPNATLGMKDL